MTKPVIAQVVGWKTTSEMWHCILSHYASHTKACEMQYKTQLLSMEKVFMSVYAFLLKIRNLIDYLATIGQPLSLKDHMNFIFNELSLKYDPFVYSMFTRGVTYTITGVEALLIAQKSWIELSKSTDVANVMANVAQASKRPSSNTNGRWIWGFQFHNGRNSANRGCGNFAPRGNFTHGRVNTSFNHGGYVPRSMN